MRSLSERLRAFEQKKARLADTEAKLKLAEKKTRLRRCIRVGELATRTGLADLDDDTLFGGFLALSRESEAKRRQWTSEGAAALAKHPVDEDREPVVITFDAQPRDEAAAALRQMGFRFNRLLRHWEGLADIEEASVLARSLGGVARPVST